MRKITFTMLIITFVLFIFLGVSKDQSLADISYSDENERDIYLNIMVSNKMQYEMVLSIVLDKHNVEFMFLNEEDSNNYIYNYETVKNLNNMDLFMYTGNDYEKWTSKVISKLNSGVGIIDLSRGIRTINYEYTDSGKTNPYYWTGIEEYKIALYNIKSAIQDKDPINREFYEENYNRQVENASKILNLYKEENIELSKYTFVTFDDYLDYFYKTIGLSYVKLGEKTIVDYATENKIQQENIIILKDVNTTFNIDGYKVIQLQKYNGELSPEGLFKSNIDTFISNIDSFQKPQ